MIVTCPGCMANYRVRNDQVPAEGAKMRCPKCKTLFLAMLPQELSAADLLAEQGGTPPPPRGPSSSSPAPAAPFERKATPAPIDGLQFSVDLPAGARAAPGPSAAPRPPSPAPPPAAPYSPRTGPPASGLPPSSPFTPLPRREPSNDLAHQASTSIEQLLGAVGGRMPVTPGVETGAHRVISPDARIDSLAPAETGDFDPFADLDIAARPPPGLEDGGVKSGIHDMRGDMSNDLGDALPTQYTFDVLEEQEVSAPQAVARVALKRVSRDDLQTLRDSSSQPSAPAAAPARPGPPAWLGQLAVAAGGLACLFGVVFALWTAHVVPLDDVLLGRFETWFDLSPPRSARKADLPAADVLAAAAETAKTRGDLLGELLLHGRLLQQTERAESRARRDEIRVELGADRLPD